MPKFSLDWVRRFLALAILATSLATTLAAQSAPTAPTRDQRALKVLAEARDLVAAGRPNESIPFYGHALDLAEAETEEPSVALANLLAEYGDVLRGAGFGERARVSLNRGLAMLEGLVDPGDSQLAIPLLALGRLDADEARCAEAETRLERGLELLAEDADPRRSVSARVALGFCAETGSSRPDLDAAFGHYRAAVLEARQASLETPEVADAMHRGAGILLRRGDLGPAVNYFEQAHQLRKSFLGESHWQTADTAHQLALALDQKGQRDAARRTTDEAVQALGRSCAPSSQAPPEVRDLCSDLSTLRRRLADDPAQVAETSKPEPPTSEPPTAEPPTAELNSAGPNSAEPYSAEPQTRFRAQTRARPPEAPAASHGPVWRVQVSSQQSPSEAERVAERVRSRFPALLRAQKLTLERADLPSGTWHRVLFGVFSERDGAVALCESLKRAGLEACLPSPSG